MAGYVGKITAASVQNAVAPTLYGTCNTAADTAAKTVICPDFTTLMHGVTIRVRFDESNTAASPTLNVNGKGAKPIYKYGTTIPGTSPAASWMAGAVISFTYDSSDGTGRWYMGDWLNTDTNTTYSNADHSNAGLMSALDKIKLDTYDIMATSLNVSKDNWSEDKDATYTDYYSNAIEVAGISTAHFPIVVFSESDIETYQLASFANTSAENTLTIYAKVKPTSNLSIPSVLFVKGVVVR